MTLVELIAPLAKNPHQDRVLAVLYYCERYEKKTALTVDEVRQELKNARAKGWAKVNVADVLSKSGPLVDTGGKQGKKRIWNLTDSGRQHVRILFGLPKAEVEREHDVGTLEDVVAKVQNADVRDYLAEAIKCLQVGSLRACTVFVWVAAIRTIELSMMSKGSGTVTAALQKHDPKARVINSLDDFAHVKDATILLAAKDLGILDKNEKDTLTEGLNLRNRCGHPGKYCPGVKKVSAFVEDITSIVFA